MPKFSSFTPFGALAFSRKSSRVEAIYRSMIGNLGDSYNTALGSNVEASVYARAREHARARYVIERAVNNANPLKATELLPVLEAEYGLTPGPSAILPQRRAALAARKLLPKGATYGNVTNALSTLLGAGFLGYRVTRASEAVSFPSFGGASPSNFVKPSTVIKQIRITGGISTGLGSPISVGFVPFDPSGGAVSLVAGDTLVVDPQIDGLTERVTVSAPSSNTFTATFVNAHDPMTFATTQLYPYWTSTQRHSLIVVTPAVALDGDKRQQINELMSRIARGVSTWDIVPSVSATNTAAFTIGDASLGRIGYAGLTSVVFP